MTDPVGPPPQGMIEGMQHLMGGAFTTLAAALTGRAMYHAGEVRARRRPILSWDLLWELPLAIGMALIAAGSSLSSNLRAISWHIGIADWTSGTLDLPALTFGRSDATDNALSIVLALRKAP